MGLFKKIGKAFKKVAKFVLPIAGGLFGGPLGAVAGLGVSGLFSSSRGSKGSDPSPAFIPPVAPVPPVPTVDNTAIQAKKEEEQKKRLRATTFSSENRTRGLLGGPSSRDDRILSKPTLLS